MTMLGFMWRGHSCPRAVVDAARNQSMRADATMSIPLPWLDAR